MSVIKLILRFIGISRIVGACGGIAAIEQKYGIFDVGERP